MTDLDPTPEQEDRIPEATMPDQGLVPADGNALRGMHFKKLLAARKTQVICGIVIVLAAIGGAVAAPVLALVAAVIAAIVCLIVIFAIADSRAEDSFFEAYSRTRGMTLSGREPCSGLTPLLRKGDDRYFDRVMTGPLDGEIDGRLALYTYEEETTDSDGNRQTSYYHFTIGIVDISETAQSVPELYCQRKFGLKALEKFEDAFRGSKDRVKFESVTLEDKFEIFANEKQDQIVLRQIFSPSFIVWLTDSAPKKIAFELVGGNLVVNVKKHREETVGLDEMRWVTAEIAKRIREKAAGPN